MTIRGGNARDGSFGASSRNSTSDILCHHRQSVHRCERSSPVKNPMRESRTSGSVRGEVGNILTYSDRGLHPCRPLGQAAAVPYWRQPARRLTGVGRGRIRMTTPSRSCRRGCPFMNEFAHFEGRH